MKGDFSRDTFNPLQHYTQVNMQQGRVQVDADWNEQQAINDYLRAVRGSDIIGLCGTPAYSRNGFAIQQQVGQWQISAGHFYVDGLLCANDSGRSLQTQPFPYDDIPNPAPGSTGLFYLDVWQRQISTLQDDNIRDKALNGADTATRTQTVWQIRFLPLAATPEAAVLLDALRHQTPLPMPEWADLIAATTGTLAARTNEAAITETPCELPPSSGYVGLENYLYRVEIHQGGDNPTFKWSRNNASFAVAVESMPSDRAIIVASTGKDELLSFQRDDWIELIGNREVYSGRPGQLAQVDQVDINTRTMTLLNPITQVADSDLETHRYLLRRWDQSGELATPNGIANSSPWITLENGIQVQLSEGTYDSGDYWLIPARTATGTIEWPPHNAPSGSAAPPLGRSHHYCPLALLGGGDRSDLRLAFPPLNHITAQDVRFDSSNCGPAMVAADTVQKALEVLCRQNGGHCTLHLAPSDDIQAILNALPEGIDARICFDAGVYNISKSISLEKKGHLLLVGAGFGTQLNGAKQETVFSFRDCASVTVRDLSVKTGTAAAAKSLNGSLTFEDCQQVSVEQVSLQCGASLKRRATCLTVRNTASRAKEDVQFGIVRILHCQLKVGSAQTGVLLINVNRAVVEDNVITAAKRPAELGFDAVIKNNKARKRVRRLLVSNYTVGKSRKNAPTNVSLQLGGETARFLAPPALQNPILWEQALSSRPEVVAEDNRRTLYALADSVLKNAAGLNSTFTRWLRQAERDDIAVVGQAIAVGGTVANDISIKNNRLECVLQGIHVGLSHRDPSRRAVDSIKTAIVTNNTIKLCLPTSAVVERHGIFIGNCVSTIIRDNYISLQRFTSSSILKIEAIRVFGYLGKRLVIEHNHIERADKFVGIRVTPIDEDDPVRPIWLISNNVASVQAADNRITRQNNAA